MTHSCSTVGREEDNGLERRDAAEPSSWCRKGGREGESSSTQESTVPIILPWLPLRCFLVPQGPPAKPCSRVQQQVCQCRDKCGEMVGEREREKEGDGRCGSTWSFHRDKEVETEASQSSSNSAVSHRRNS